MAIQIRYLSTPRDFWIADFADGRPGGVWVTRPELAKPFDGEAEARQFLAANGYDLPVASVVYESCNH